MLAPPDKGCAQLVQVSANGLLDRVLAWAQFKQSADLKKPGSAKKALLLGIPKLDDANFAGSSKAEKCTLILTEGDSAKSLAISGLSVVGRDLYGVFPLKGKLLNVREASTSTIKANAVSARVACLMCVIMCVTVRVTAYECVGAYVSE